MSRRVLAVGMLAAIAATLAFLRLGWGAQPQLELVSVSSAEVHGNAASNQASLSADGRYVAFTSSASNLVPNDMNGPDVFVRDRQAGTTELISRTTGGVQANGPALFPAISANGRYVAFESTAANLSSTDGDPTSDIFVRDRQMGTTELASVGEGAPANDDSNTPAISGDGRYVTFTSLADNLVASDGNMDRDVFVYDRMSGTTELVSMATDGTHGNFASGGLGAGPARTSSDGRYVIFGSFADNLVANDLNSKDDVFVRDRTMDTTERVSIATNGTEGDSHSVYGSISDDGRYAVWWSDATTLVPNDGNPAADAFLRDRMTSTTTLLSAVPGGGEDPDGASRFPVISADGAFVAFQSVATNLVTPDTNGSTDILLLRLADSQLTRIAYGNGDSTLPATSADGSTVAFQSLAPDLAPEDGDSVSDVFAWGKSLAPPTPTRTSTPTPTRTPTALPYPTGDADCSTAVDAVDATRVLQLAAGLVGTLPCLLQADANVDQQVSSVDALLILQYVVGLLDQLPPG